jgi:hypothetical protein
MSLSIPSKNFYLIRNTFFYRKGLSFILWNFKKKDEKKETMDEGIAKFQKIKEV